MAMAMAMAMVMAVNPTLAHDDAPHFLGLSLGVIRSYY
jgi:hypothetical protein